MEENIKENPTILEPPTNIIVWDRVHRLSKILYSVAITSSILIFVCFLSSIITPLLYATAILVLFTALIMMVVFTLGLAFLLPGRPVARVLDIIQSLIGGGDLVAFITQACFNSTKWLALVGIIASIVSIVLISIGKQRHKGAKIVLLSILILICGVVFAFQIITGGMTWQG